MGRIKSKHINIYVTAGFKATWQKYLEICERDGVSAAREIRKYVEGQVKMRAPGNPVPPLTAFFEGHPDVATRAWSSTLKDLVAYAERRDGGLSYFDVVAELKAQGVEGSMLAARAKSMCETLESLGVKIWR